MANNDNPQARRLMASMAKHGEQEAAERFAQAHPLGKTADIKKKFAWAKDLCAFLEERYGDETIRDIRTDCACGPSVSGNAKFKALYKKEGNPRAFAEAINGLDLGFSLDYNEGAFYLTYPQCYCPCVRRNPEPLPKAWCYCTLGYSKRMFEDILGTEVDAELLSSVKMGDETCRIRIRAKG